MTLVTLLPGMPVRVLLLLTTPGHHHPFLSWTAVPLVGVCWVCWRRLASSLVHSPLMIHALVEIHVYSPVVYNNIIHLEIRLQWREEGVR